MFFQFHSTIRSQESKVDKKATQALFRHKIASQGKENRISIGENAQAMDII
jgi:hypothetical protein